MNESKWDAMIGIQEVHGECHPGLAEAYIKLFETYVKPPKKVLEMGLGEGPLETDMLVKKGYDVMGITIRPWQVLRNNITLMDMHDLKFKPDTFDAIFTAVTLEHSYAPWLLALEASVVLKSKGIFFIVVPQENQYQLSTHPCLLSKGQWQSILSYAGFSIIKAEVVNFKVSCNCEGSDMGTTPRGVMGHNENMIVIVAEKGSPQSPDVLATLNKLKVIHSPNPKNSNFPYKHLIEPNQKRVSILWSALKDYLKTNDTVFDMMCGYSHLASQLTATGHKVTGLEIDLDAVEYLISTYPNQVWIRNDAQKYLSVTEMKHHDVLLIIGTSHPPMASESFQATLSVAVSQMNPRVILMETGISDPSKPWVQAFPMTLKTLTELGYVEKASGEFDSGWEILEVRYRKYVVLEKGKKIVGSVR